ncbi:FHA domain-containing protein [Kineosporia babensis]|uniref:FHA domain-containing protein n=1 Tax=Kineosporia babensis TaxID=499548 RepID=A0A9X1NE77_9ACTN|nr:FHA domain-containing protein [Kineosporia babensis]MCD5312180.1 FHA domain-containing protein [Kineosporia babensis]
MSVIESSSTAVIPGDGLVHRGSGVVLTVAELTAGQLPQAQALIEACGRMADDSSGRATVLAVAEMATRCARQDLPAFGLALDTDQGLVVLLHDQAEAEIRPVGGSAVRLRGTDSLAWVERRFTEPVDGFELWTTSSPQTCPGTESVAMEGIALNLSRGTLHGGGVVLARTPQARTLEAQTSEAQVSEAQVSEAQVSEAQTEEQVPADLAVTAERRMEIPALLEVAEIHGQTEFGTITPHEPEPAPPPEPQPEASGERSLGSLLPSTPHFGQPQLPIQAHLQPVAETAAVFEPRKPPPPPPPLRTPGGGLAIPRPNIPPIEGVLCSRSHFNDPKASYCAICGISLQQVTRRITHRPRPTLGVLVLDDGTSVTIDSDLIIGRDPATHPAVQAGDAKPMYLNDEVNGVSRVHARITLVDWSVCLTDEGSANGTYLMDAGGNHAVHGEDAAELAGGTVIRIGRRTLTFDGYHSAGE